MARPVVAAVFVLAAVLLCNVAAADDANVEATELMTIGGNARHLNTWPPCGFAGQDCCPFLPNGKRKLLGGIKKGACYPGSFCSNAFPGFIGRRKLSGVWAIFGTCIACGGNDQTCCPAGSGNGQPGCGSGLRCRDSKCTDCGLLDQACCGGSICDGGLFCLSGQCKNCGVLNGPCCGGQANGGCPLGSQCAADGFCRACGVVGATCCPGNVCSGDLTCSAGQCTDCGTNGKPCCSSGSACQGGLFCAASINGNTCSTSCGLVGDKCCLGNTCRSAGLSCGASGTCELDCGEEGQSCCPVTSNGAKSACVDETLVCSRSGTRSRCVACGDVDQPCCSGNFCNDDLACRSSNGKRTCKAPPPPSPVISAPTTCGGFNLPCCLTGGVPACSTPLVCSTRGFCTGRGGIGGLPGRSGIGGGLPGRGGIGSGGIIIVKPVVPGAIIKPGRPAGPIRVPSGPIRVPGVIIKPGGPVGSIRVPSDPIRVPSVPVRIYDDKVKDETVVAGYKP